jgi:hypothetical protein
MRRSIWVVSGALVLVLSLAGAAFVGGRLLNDEPSGSGPVAMQGPDRPGRVMAREPDVAYAEELPASPPEVIGLFGRRQDNSLFIQSGETTMNIKRDDQGNVELETHADGPEVEVIVTHDTLLYRDDTFTQYSGEASARTLQQVLNPGTLDEMGEHSSLQVWGQRRGDRVVAEVILYTFPVALK